MLNPEEFAPGRQIQDGTGTVLDVLDTLTGATGQTYLIVAHDDAPGLALLVPVAPLRDEETDWEAVDPEAREKARQQAEEDRQAQERREQEEFQRWRAQQGQQQPPTPAPAGPENERPGENPAPYPPYQPPNQP